MSRNSLEFDFFSCRKWKKVLMPLHTRINGKPSLMLIQHWFIHLQTAKGKKWRWEFAAKWLKSKWNDICYEWEWNQIHNMEECEWNSNREPLSCFISMSYHQLVSIQLAFHCHTNFAHSVHPTKYRTRESLRVSSSKENDSSSPIHILHLFTLPHFFFITPDDKHFHRWANFLSCFFSEMNEIHISPWMMFCFFWWLFNAARCFES